MKTRRYRSAYKEGKKAGYLEGYKQGLHDGNPFVTLAESINNVFCSLSDSLSDPDFVEALKKARAIENNDREYFNGRCPYTDKPCEDWNCLSCKVENQEREWLEGDE